MKTNQRIKLSDLATALNLSTSTVSRALNDHPRIPIETRTKVKKLANDWAYHPNPFAKGLFSKETKTIGVMIPCFEDNYFSKILGIIEDELIKKGYKLICTRSGKNAVEEQSALWNLAKAHVDGIIAVLSYDQPCPAFINDINEEGIPILFLDRMYENVDASFVISDDFQGAFEAVSYLIQEGRSKILHLEGPRDLSTSFYRKQGYMEALKKHDLEIQHSIQCENKEDVKIKIKAYNNDYDAVFCYNDFYAFEMLEYAKQQGICIPNEVAVIGYANDPLSSFTSPKLTTVDQSTSDLGEQSVKMLLSEIKAMKSKGSFEYSTFKSSTRLLVRESC
ncbi:LacI family DNA-binding transcriptional regulator [Flammeovirga aprica]|uniref:LacI family transcriptional regulator n=1 Tax=Flammeovirga aprica JL-4 TaxID=694437 RepID=A0A7X9XDI3_9BACT|nr:LacI family DNA-binding transcriptional regulator [Flammeovirga aprica]NME72835.1 LacI family transcriptional regulator [Flammeovirga aprica JL-4]